MYDPVFPNYHPDDFTVYEFCLNGCCGSTTIDGMKNCCDEIGVFFGIFVGMMIFCVLIAAACALYRRGSRQNFRINGGLSERGRLIPPPSQYTSTAGHDNYQSQAQYNYQQTNTGTRYMCPPKTGPGQIYSQQVIPNAPVYQT
ncbi:Hypothetical predicted protein [Mytilus galloprovincialis]|uniref:Uncharacterized protein n=1 Tax=Mytilus galloprovincialis TaxID=29158 RepID=A0A8B6GL18_MYTGA|nr:Hypothetical predicted protein [Mytilus galloprovincialis]